MKTVFIINPKAGRGEGAKLKEKILKTIKTANADAVVLETKCTGDGTRVVEEYYSENGSAKFIACGGDGTFGEVLNGAMKIGVPVGFVPIGTGNDFCRNFSGYDFYNIEKLLDGKISRCDAIKYSGTINGENRVGYCANMINIGFDCNVADETAKMKKKPFVSGSFAYFLSVFKMLVKKKGATLKIFVDGEQKHSGKLLLTSIANGKFCGGGVKSNPDASLCDGKMDINIVNNMTRLQFIHKLPYYMKGTHKKLKNIERLIRNFKGKKLLIEPEDGKMRICVDGEIFDTGKIEFEVIEGAFDFVLPCEENVSKSPLFLGDYQRK